MYYMMHETFIEYSQGYKWNQLLLERNPSGRIPREDTYFTFWHKQTGLYPRRSLPYTDYRVSPPLPPTGTVLCCPLRSGRTTKAGLLAGGPLRTHVTASLRAPGDWHPCQISPRTPQGSGQQFVFGPWYSLQHHSLSGGTEFELSLLRSIRQK